jgi:hypothetical protein
MTDDIVTRLRKQHTIQYGWKLGELVKHTEHNSDPQIRDRMNRCEVCEQWSPCDGIKAADEIERLRAEVARLGAFLHPVGMVINTEHGAVIPKAGIEGVTDEEVNEYLKAVRGD